MAEFLLACAGHTLRLLSVPDFVEASLDKIIRLRKRLGAASAAVRGLFGAGEKQDEAITKLESLKVCRLGPRPLTLTHTNLVHDDSHSIRGILQVFDSGV